MQNCAVYKIMWKKNTVQPDMPQKTMCFGCWITKAKNTHSESLILIALAQQPRICDPPHRYLVCALPVARDQIVHSFYSACKITPCVLWIPKNPASLHVSNQVFYFNHWSFVLRVKYDKNYCHFGGTSNFLLQDNNEDIFAITTQSNTGSAQWKQDIVKHTTPVYTTSQAI